MCARVFVFMLTDSVFVHVEICARGDLRLVGGSSPLEGRLEVCYYNQWGTVCDDDWGTMDARVACRQLGYSGESNDSK